jgi:hypothetical protein
MECRRRRLELTRSLYYEIQPEKKKSTLKYIKTETFKKCISKLVNNGDFKGSDKQIWYKGWL